jgi:uncharacterized protein (DUF2461 family)
MEYVITSLFSIILALTVWRLKDWLSYKINPDIKLRRAPRNIFEHITPGTTVDKVKELLHTPYYNEAFVLLTLISPKGIPSGDYALLRSP